MTTRVPEGKRHEFIDALETLPARSQFAPDASETSIEEGSRVCWLARWRDEANARGFIQGDAYRTLRCAAEVLGDIVSLNFGEDPLEKGREE